MLSIHGLGGLGVDTLPYLKWRFLWECDTCRGMSHELFKEQFWLYS